MTIAAVLLLAAVQLGADANADNPTSRGTISVEDESGHVAWTASRVFDAAVERALANADFVALEDCGHSRFIARVSVSRSARGMVNAPVRKTGANTDIGNWGAAMQVPLPSHKAQLTALTVTELHVEIQRRGDPRPIWRGSAITVQSEGTAAGDVTRVAQKLADGLIARYPAKLEGPISIP